MCIRDRGKAEMWGVKGVRMLLATDEEVSAAQKACGYDSTNANGRTWHSQQPAPSLFHRCHVAGMVWS